MSIRAKAHLDWLNNPADRASVANAKLTLAVIKIVEILGRKSSLKDKYDLGSLFAPAFMACPEELRLAGGKLFRSTLEYSEEELAECLNPAVQLDHTNIFENENISQPPQVSRLQDELSDEKHDDCTDDVYFSASLFDDHFADDDAMRREERTMLKQEKIVRLIKSRDGHEWILEMLNKPSPASRKLFIAAQRAIRRFIAKAASIENRSKPTNIDLLTNLLGLNPSEILFLELADTIQKTTITSDLLDFVRGHGDMRVALKILCSFDSRQRKGLLDNANALRISGLFEDKDFNSHTDLGIMFKTPRQLA